MLLLQYLSSFIFNKKLEHKYLSYIMLLILPVFVILTYYIGVQLSQTIFFFITAITAISTIGVPLKDEKYREDIRAIKKYIKNNISIMWIVISLWFILNNIVLIIVFSLLVSESLDILMKVKREYSI